MIDLCVAIELADGEVQAASIYEKVA